MSWGNACYCSNEECARAGRCLGPKLTPFGPGQLNPWPGVLPAPTPPLREYYPPPTELSDATILRIAKKVVELLSEQNKKGEEDDCGPDGGSGHPETWGND